MAGKSCSATTTCDDLYKSSPRELARLLEQSGIPKSTCDLLIGNEISGQMFLKLRSYELRGYCKDNCKSLSKLEKIHYELKNKDVCCSYKENGCPWTGKLSKLEAHLLHSCSVRLQVGMHYGYLSKEGKSASKQFKVVTIGAAFAGKTSTKDTLLGKPFNIEMESTKGAKVSLCTIDRQYTVEWRESGEADMCAQLHRMRKGEIKRRLSSEQHNPECVVTSERADQVPVDLAEEVLDNSGSYEQKFRLTMFDLGGQHIYHDIHTIFLNEEDVFLLAYDASVELDAPVSSGVRLGRWEKEVCSRRRETNIQVMENILTAIHCRYCKKVNGSLCLFSPVVLMVGTHAENISTAKQTEIARTIRERFDKLPFMGHLPKEDQKVRAFYFISNSERARFSDEIVELKLAIVEAGMLTADQSRPISYLKVEEEILKLAKCQAKVSYSEFSSMVSRAGENGICDEKVHEMLKYFTSKGHLLYFPKSECLRNIVFLSPQEVSNLITSVISTRIYLPSTAMLQDACDRYEQHALLNEAFLDYMLKECGRSEDKAKVIELLKQFVIAAEVPEGTKFQVEEGQRDAKDRVFFVPCMLVYKEIDTKPTICDGKQEQELNILYHFENKFLPELAFNCLLVKVVDWCCRKDHLISCVNHGVGYFFFEKGSYQRFQLLLNKATHSVCCKICVKTAPSDKLDDLLKQRKELLDCLKQFFKSIKSICLTQEPQVHLECPLAHSEDAPIPHLCIDKSFEELKLICYHRPGEARIVHKKYYSLLLPQPKTKPDKEKPSMKEIIRHVIPFVAHQWEMIAYAVGTSRQEVEIIKRDYQMQGVKMCAVQFFVEWLGKTSNVSWTDITDLLRDIGAESSIVETLNELYINA